ncbi:MAG: cupin domain-containing protein [Rhodothalassiaceae bacterium]
MPSESPPRPIVSAEVPEITSTLYPPPHDRVVAGRGKRRLGLAAGLTQFGVNLTRLAPGAATALLHWHSHEEEAVYMLAGEAVLESGTERHVMKAGDFVGFPAGGPHGHRIVNESNAEALLLEIGSRVDGDTATYPGLPLRAEKIDGGYRFTVEDQNRGRLS